MGTRQSRAARGNRAAPAPPCSRHEPAVRAPVPRRRHGPQPRLGLAHVPVLRGRRDAVRLAPGAPRRARPRRRRPGHDRGHRGQPGGADQPAGHRHLERRAGARPGRGWPRSCAAHGADRGDAARPRRPQGELRTGRGTRRRASCAPERRRLAAGRARARSPTRASPSRPSSTRPASRRSGPTSSLPRSAPWTPASTCSRSTPPTATCCTSSSRRCRTLRTDGYGGSFEGRTRLLLEVVDDVARRRRRPAARAHQRHRLGRGRLGPRGVGRAVARCSQQHGVALVDVSSGGNVAHQKITVGPGYQVPFAAAVRETGVLTAAVGMITEPEQAERVLADGHADAVLLARESLRDPNWPLRAAAALGAEVTWPVQYERAKPRRDRARGPALTAGAAPGHRPGRPGGRRLRRADRRRPAAQARARRPASSSPRAWASCGARRSSGYPCRSLLVAPSREAELPDDLRALGPVHVASYEVLEAVTGFHVHRGVLASFGRLPVPSAAEVLRRRPAGRRLRGRHQPHQPRGGLPQRGGRSGWTRCCSARARATRSTGAACGCRWGEVFAVPYAYLPELARAGCRTCATPASACSRSRPDAAADPARPASCSATTSGWRCCSAPRGRG